MYGFIPSNNWRYTFHVASWSKYEMLNISYFDKDTTWNHVCQCTHIQIYNAKLLFVFQFQSKSWGIPVCCHVRSEQTGCVRNLSKKKTGELQHLLTLLMVVFILNPYNGSTALLLQFSCQFNRVISRERSGSVVECLTRDQRVAGSSLTGVTVLWSLSKTHLS